MFFRSLPKSLPFKAVLSEVIMLSFRNIGEINRFDRDTVYGYIKRVQKLIKSQNIPVAIQYICLLFFYEIDQFTEDGTINLLAGYDGCSYFGMMDITNSEYLSNFICQWRFEYYTDPDKYRPITGFINTNVIIGITDSSNVHWYASNYGHHIALSKYGDLYQTKYMPSQSCETEYYTRNTIESLGIQKWIYAKDQIIISMDIKEKKMEYVLRSDGIDRYCIRDISIMFPSKNHKHRMAVYCQGIGMKVKLIKFNKIIRTSGKIHPNEQIQDQIERIQCEEWLIEKVAEYKAKQKQGLPGFEEDIELSELLRKLREFE